ncbi:MAG: cobyric acid synthase [Acidimicrobiia bacterium]
MSLRPLMILGCTSGAGKSLIVTALARWFSRQGVGVAPFKAQNMSNNARVVDGGEIGVAQWLQARAARVEPSVDMNPVLLKPEADTRSQVIVSGTYRPDISAMPWRHRGPYLWPAMEDAYRRLNERYDLVLIEGAGSPAETNLEDLVNNRILQHTDAAGILVVDIDRGGAFAHLYGTWMLVPEATRTRLAGYVLNQFRGDSGLLEPGPSDLTQMTSMSCVEVVPMLCHELPDEEGATIRGEAPDGSINVAVVRWPYASNLDEFHLLARTANMRWASGPSDLEQTDLIILPGSKHVAASAEWLRSRHLDRAIVEKARAGTKVFGICGGAMLLGHAVSDPTGVEGATTGIGLLPLTTTMDPGKVITRARLEVDGLPDPWASLNGISTAGYEIRNGRISGEACAVGPQLWASGSVLATTVHGLLEDPVVLEALTGHHPDPVLEPTFERLADAIDTHLDTDHLMRLVKS